MFQAQKRYAYPFLLLVALFSSLATFVNAVELATASFSWQPVKNLGLFAPLGVACWWASAKTAPPAIPGARMKVMLAMFVGGVLGAVAGFAGPLVLAPESSQGPLLAIFTAPVAAVLGGVLAIALEHQGEERER